MNKSLILISLAALASCSPPDRRRAQVVFVEERLTLAVGEAISDWRASVGADLDWVLSSTCDNDDAQRVRVKSVPEITVPINATISKELPDARVGGITRGHVEDVTMDLTSNVEIAEWVFSAREGVLRGMLTHEFGHCLGLGHLSYAGVSSLPQYEIMEPVTSKSGHDCVGPKTCAAYTELYGTPCRANCW